MRCVFSCVQRALLAPAPAPRTAAALTSPPALPPHSVSRSRLTRASSYFSTLTAACTYSLPKYSTLLYSLASFSFSFSSSPSFHSLFIPSCTPLKFAAEQRVDRHLSNERLCGIGGLLVRWHAALLIRRYGYTRQQIYPPTNQNDILTIVITKYNIIKNK